jgi:hypothetical protein
MRTKRHFIYGVDNPPMAFQAPRMLLLAAVVAALSLALPTAAWAYVDPTSGSIFLQLLLGGFAGLLVAVKLTYRRILERFGRRSPEPVQPTGGDVDAPR